MDLPNQPLTKKREKELKKLEKLEHQQKERKKQKLIYLLLVFSALVIVGLFIFALIYIRNENIRAIKTDKDPSQGPDNALVEIREYSDFTCPACQMAALYLRLALVDYKDKVKLIYNDLANPGHKNSFESAVAAECAWKQNKFWEFHDLLFEKQNEWVNSNEVNKKMEEYAQSLSLNADDFKQCLDNKEVKDSVSRDLKEAVLLKIESTPTFFVNDEKMVGVKTTQDWKDLFEQKLSAGK